MPDTKSKAMRAGLKGHCPHCYEGALFAGFLKFADNCQSCGFSYQIEDAGDGPAVFVMFIASIFIVPLALVFQIKLDAPIWLTLLIFVPAIIAACLLLLRPFRGLMFALQVSMNASQEQFNDEN